MKRIHIVGCSPRSGTTLMLELMVSCFEIDGFSEHEMTIFSYPKQDFKVFCSKQPRDILCIPPLLAIDPNLWIIYLLRDPRDIVVSRHGENSKLYWTNLRHWKSYTRAARRVMNHPRFLTVRYENLVKNPNKVQQELMAKLPFLKKRANFSDYDKIARPSQKSLNALGGLRPIATNSIGIWHQHKPRLAAQLELHGSIAEELIEFGYETDDAWLSQINQVQPDNGVSRWPEHLPPWTYTIQVLRDYRNIVRYALELWLSKK
ncbi:MAG TPA: sulfotransferase family protein [Cyanobacteria bacterium UBA11162]|nr:sulfotransferase family protein [Cyanobacteria bacterium UBA11162]